MTTPHAAAESLVDFFFHHSAASHTADISLAAQLWFQATPGEAPLSPTGKQWASQHRAVLLLNMWKQLRCKILRQIPHLWSFYVISKRLHETNITEPNTRSFAASVVVKSRGHGEVCLQPDISFLLLEIFTVQNSKNCRSFAEIILVNKTNPIGFGQGSHGNAN